MKLSTTFVLIAAAFTGSVNAAEIINGNLRASALQKTTEVFADISLQQDDPAVLDFEGCMASCVVSKKPSRKEASTISRSDIAEGLTGCIQFCYDDNTDEVRTALEDKIPKSTALECADPAAKKYKEVSSKCGSVKSLKCKKGKDCDSDDEKKANKCLKEYDECEKCASEAKKAISSIKKVTKELDSCIFGTEDTESEIKALQEHHTTAEVQLEDCIAHIVTTGKPKSKDLPGVKEEDIAEGLNAVVEACYQYAADKNADVENRLKQVIPLATAEQCVETAAEKYKEVSKKCGSMKSLKCKSCASDDTDDKCQKEYDDCEKCVKELKQALSSLKKVGGELEKCLLSPGTDAESAIKIA